MPPKVSIIIPCFNAGRFIDTGLRSIYDQDYPDVELIVVNDGSTDDSEERILAWQPLFERKGFCLKYLRQENLGQACAAETGLAHVTGTYLTLLDADDYFLPGSLSRRAAFLEAHPDYAAVRSNGWLERGTKRELFITSDAEKNMTDLFSGLILGQTNNWAGTYMVRTDLLFEAYPDRKIYTSRYGQNLQILLPVAYGRKFGYIDEPLMVYVLHGDSHSQAVSPAEQFEKEERNALGYRDIYIHMLDEILRDPAEHRRYTNAFEGSYHRCAMLRAIKYQKTELARQHYTKLRATGLATLNDRIAYQSYRRSPAVIPLKILRKIITIRR